MEYPILRGWSVAPISHISSSSSRNTNGSRRTQQVATIGSATPPPERPTAKGCRPAAARGLNLIPLSWFITLSTLAECILRQ